MQGLCIFQLKSKTLPNILSCSVDTLKTVYFVYSKNSFYIFGLIITVSVKSVCNLLLVLERMAMAKGIL